METTSASEFGWLARRLAITARSAGLSAPGFRSPPKAPGRVRTVQRYPGGNALVSVRTKNRDRQTVIDDMIEGVIVANGLHDGVATAARRTLLNGLAQQTAQTAA